MGLILGCSNHHERCRKRKMCFLSNEPGVALPVGRLHPSDTQFPPLLCCLCLLFPSFFLIFCLLFLFYPQTPSSLCSLPRWVMSCQNNGLLCFIELPLSCSPFLSPSLPVFSMPSSPPLTLFLLFSLSLKLDGWMDSWIGRIMKM